MVNKKFRRRHIFSVVFTVFVVFLLVFSGTTLAVVVDVAADKSTYTTTDTTVVFTVQVDVETNERIPVQNLTLTITGPNSFSKNCTFTTSGSNLTSCTNLNITRINEINYTSGEMFGYGYGYNYTSGEWGTENQTFGTGYGYAAVSGYNNDSSLFSELAYNISWSINAEIIGGGSYYANLEANSQSGSDMRLYTSQTPLAFAINRGWWNASWSYCKNVTITENSGGTWTNPAFPFESEINCSSNCMPNASDIRVVNASCNNGGSAIPFGLKVNGADNFTIATSFTTSTVYAIYYGNTTPVERANSSYERNRNNWFAGSDSEGSAGSADPNWLLVSSGTQAIDETLVLNGTKSMFMSSGSPDCRANASSSYPLPTFTNYTQVELMVRTNTSSDENFYLMLLDVDSAKIGCNIYMRDMNKDLGHFRNTGSWIDSEATWYANVWYNFTIQAEPSSGLCNLTVTFAENGTTVFTANGTTGWEAGWDDISEIKILHSNEPQQISVDSASARRWLPDSRMPTIALGSEEIGNNALTWSSPYNNTPAYYNSTPSDFQVGWSDDNDANGYNFSWFSTNCTGSWANYTTQRSNNISYVNITLPACSDAKWKFYANDSSNVWNVTDEWSFTINQGATLATLYLNGTTTSQTSIYPNSTINATAVSNVSGLYVQLWRNGTLINNATSTAWNITGYGVQNNNFTAQVLGNENYSSSSVATLWWNVSKGAPTCTLDSTAGWNYTYETSTNLTCSCTGDGTSHLYFAGVEHDEYNDTSTLFASNSGVGVVCNSTEVANYTNASASNTLNISKKNANVKVYPTTQTINYSQAVTQYCTDEAELLNCSIYRNGTEITNNSQIILEAGTYTYTGDILVITNHNNYQNTTILTVVNTDNTTGTYTNNSVSNTANSTSTVNATTSSNTTISLEIVTTSNVSDSSISITEYNSTPPNTTGVGIYGLDKFFDISIGSGLSSSLGWVMINISYNESKVTEANLNESSLKLYRFNATSGSWENVTPSGVNTASNYVWGNLTSFSSFGLGGLKTDGQSCTANANCYSGYCVHNVCRPSSTYCGDGYCDSGETNAICPSDCSAASGGGGGGWMGSSGAVEEEEEVEEEVEEAEEVQVCGESWSCAGWSECVNEIQRRMCTDANACGTIADKPAESQGCVTPTPAVTPTTPLGVGIGLVSIVAVSVIIIFIIMRKRKKTKKKQNLRAIL